jgi:uncharacterized protein YbjT (DUF2867 family)
MTSQLHVVFGTGPLAQAVVSALIKRGHHIRMVNRSGTRPPGVPSYWGRPGMFPTIPPPSPSVS